MKYIVTKIKKAEGVGIVRFNHLISESGEILLNEMEVNINANLDGTFEERVNKLSGKVMNTAEAKDYTITNNFEICSRQQ